MVVPDGHSDPTVSANPTGWRYSTLIYDGSNLENKIMSTEKITLRKDVGPH